MHTVAVATSGGRDSTALLHATCQAAAGLGIRVLALHVHHGLQAAADDWLRQVSRQARRWGAAFDHRRLQGSPGSGESLEAWARRERYAALAEMAGATGCGLVLLAHHRRDQAETFLLQALRGAGAAGLASMPVMAQRLGITWVRPWLDQPREAIEAYVRRHRLAHVDDPSNADARLARSRLRVAVWPALHAAFPSAELALAASAAQAQDAASLADHCWALDRASLVRDGALDLAACLALSGARSRNALRHWLREQLGRSAPETLVRRLQAETRGRATGTWDVPGGSVQLYREQLRVQTGSETAAASSPPRPTVRLDLSRPGDHPVPVWRGTWRVARTTEGGIAAADLRDVEMTVRRGGERFRRAPAAASRSLKQQFQAAAVRASQREGPLLFGPSGALLYVWGLGLNAEQLCGPGQPQRRLDWIPDPAPTGSGQAGR